MVLGTLADVPWPPVLGVSGYSDSGKTVLIEQLLPRLEARGLRVGVIKDSHHAIEADRPGKDSDRLFRAGADVVVTGSTEAFARLHPEARSWGAVVRGLFAGHDLVLAEGFRDAPIPRIAVGNTAGADALLVVDDPVTQADLATEAVWTFLVRGHHARSLVRVLMERVEVGRLFGPKPTDARRRRLLRAALANLRDAARCHPGARLVIIPDDAEPGEDLIGWLLGQGGPGIDAVLPAGDQPPVALLEPPVGAVLEEASAGEVRLWHGMLGGRRARRPGLPTTEEGPR